MSEGECECECESESQSLRSIALPKPRRNPFLCLLLTLLVLVADDSTVPKVPCYKPIRGDDSAKTNAQSSTSILSPARRPPTDFLRYVQNPPTHSQSCIADTQLYSIGLTLPLLRAFLLLCDAFSTHWWLVSSPPPCDTFKKLQLPSPGLIYVEARTKATSGTYLPAD